MIMCFLFAYTLVHFHFYIYSYYVTDEDDHDFMLGVLFQIMSSYLSYAGVSNNCFFARATHNLYQLVKRHQKQAAQAEETPDQLNQVYSLSLLSVFSPNYILSLFSGLLSNFVSR